MLNLRERLVRNGAIEPPSHCGDCDQEIEDLLPHLQLRGRAFPELMSLCINTQNEGPDLAQTCLSFARPTLGPLELCILADGTSDDSLDMLKRTAFPPNVQDVKIVVNADAPVGCGRAKARLDALASGVYRHYSDGHNRLIRGSLDLAAFLSGYFACIVQPALGPLHGWPTRQATEKVPDNCYYGGALRVKDGWMDIDQKTLRHRSPIKRVDCVNNSSFGMHRQILAAIGGWHEFPNNWGHQEAGLSWRAWWTKTPIMCARDIVVLHRYEDWWTGPEAEAYYAAGGRRRKSTPKGEHGGKANLRYATYVCFDTTTWNAYWSPLVERDPQGARDQIAGARERMQKQHDEFQKLKKRTDDEFFMEIAKLPFNPATARAKEGAVTGLYLITGGLGNALMCVPAMKALAQLSGEPIDVVDMGLHVKGLIDWIEMQPWIARVRRDRDAVDYRDYKYVIGSYWEGPKVDRLEGCVISPANKQHRTKHESHSNIEAVRNAGFTGVTPSPFLTLDESTIEHAALSTENAQPAAEYIAICTEAAGRRDDVDKCWPHWEACCRQLRDAGVRMIFLGNNDDRPAWMDEVGDNLVGKTQFLQALRIIKGARLFVGIDNGLAHCAAALKTPQIVLYGTTSPRKNLQLTQAQHVIMADWACAPCFDTSRKKRCAQEQKGAKPCMRSIPQERVAQKILHLMNWPYADAMPHAQSFLSRKQIVENCKVEMFQSWPELTELLHFLQQLDPQRVIVIGAHHCAWELIVSSVCSEGTKFISIDAHDDPRRQEITRVLNEWHYPVEFIKGWSHEQATRDAVERTLGDSLADVLYIDGDHAYERVETDTEMYQGLVRPGGLMIYHDVSNFVNADAPGSRKHWAETMEKHGGTLIQIRHGNGHGFGILRKARASQ